MCGNPYAYPGRNIEEMGYMNRKGNLRCRKAAMV
jgi:hypothetical protein